MQASSFLMSSKFLSSRSNVEIHSCDRASKINSDVAGCMLGLLWETLSICSSLQSWSWSLNLDYLNETHFKGSALLSQPPLLLAQEPPQHLSPRQLSQAPSFKAWLPTTAYSHSSQTSDHVSPLPQKGPTDCCWTQSLSAKMALLKKTLHDLDPGCLLIMFLPFLSIASPSSLCTC